MPLRSKLSFSPFSFLGEGLGMRACESKDAIFFFLCFGERRVPFKDKTINRVDSQSPHPWPLSQRERGKQLLYRRRLRSRHIRCRVGRPLRGLTPLTLSCVFLNREPRALSSRTRATHRTWRVPAASGPTYSKLDSARQCRAL